MGARGFKSVSSSWISISFSSSTVVNFTEKPYSSANKLIVSASSRWLIETNKPKLIQVVMICVEGTSINDASSPTEINSVTFKILFSCSCFSCSSIVFCRTISLLSRLCFTDLDFSLCCRRASVSFICFCTSSSLISLGAVFLFL